MGIVVKEINGRKYVEVQEGTTVITREEDAVDLAGICGVNDTDLLLLSRDTLPEEFYDLKSGLAGAVLQKFSNYRIKAAAIIQPEKITGRFREMVIETNRGNHFRVFKNREDAERWLTG